MRPIIVLAALAAACSTSGLDASPEQDMLSAPVAGQLALPQSLVMFMRSEPLVAGRWIDFQVNGATPGAQVGIAVSNGTPGAGACPRWIGDCLDITPGTSGYRFVLLGVADANGVVNFTGSLPRSFAAGDWSFQAISPSGAGGSFVGSLPQARTVLPFRTNCVGDDGFENDDAGTLATAITVGHSSTGRVLCDQDDVDWHSILMTAGQEIVVDATFIDDEGDLDVYIVDDATKNNVTVLDTIYLERGYSADDNESVTFTAPADGTYYIGVRQYADDGTAPGNTYDLDVTGLSEICTIDFEDAYAAFGDSVNPTTYYGAYGVTFTQTSGYGLIGGELNGDSSNWTDAPGVIPDAAWGCWDNTNAEVNTIAFAAPVTDVDFTVYAGNTGSPQTLVVEGFYAGSSTGFQLFTLDYAGPTSVNPTIAGPVDSIQLNIASGSFAYSVDNLTYTTDTLVCP